MMFTKPDHPFRRKPTMSNQTSLKADLPVYQYNIAGELLNQYDNPAKACKAIGVNPSVGASYIIKASRGLHKSAYGYIWREKPININTLNINSIPKTFAGNN